MLRPPDRNVIVLKKSKTASESRGSGRKTGSMAEGMKWE